MYSNKNEYEYCPRCDANLTLQKGYNNNLPYWICKGCGEMLINPDISADDDIAWFCDGCNAMLNIQKGFSSTVGNWRCSCCGFINAICDKNLYDTKESYEKDLKSPYKGLNDEEILMLSSYREIRNITGRPDILLVEDPDSKNVYIKKYLTVYDMSIYKYLKDNPVPGMPRIYELAEGSNCLVVIEEYIDGNTLGALIEDGKLNAEQALDTAIGICRILKTIHNLPCPIIHRDIKPSNVIVSRSGDVFLLDMNAAKWGSPGKSDDTNFFGTWNYAAPEQLWYGLTASSPKSDIYALGVLINVMLTGSIPKKKHAGEPYWTFIERCICLEPDDRYDAEELLNVLEKIRGENEGNV